MHVRTQAIREEWVQRVEGKGDTKKKMKHMKERITKGYGRQGWKRTAEAKGE